MKYEMISLIEKILIFCNKIFCEFLKLRFYQKIYQSKEKKNKKIYKISLPDMFYICFHISRERFY